MTTGTEPQRTPALPEEPQRTPTLPEEPYYRRGEGARRWGGLLLVVGVVWLVFELIGRGPLLGLGTVERTAAVPAQVYAVERVVVSGLNDDIELVGWSEDGVELEAVKHGFGWNGAAADAALEGIELAVSQSGDTLNVEVRRPSPFRSFLGRAPYVRLRLALPEGVDIQASTVNGDITAEGVRGDGALSTVSGAIDVENSAGALQINTTSGNVELRDFRGALVAESVSGDIDAEGAISAPRVETVSGSVDLSGASGEAQLTSISGDLRLREARDVVLRLESTSGDIVVDGALAADAESRIGNISGEVSVALPGVDNLQLEATTVSGDLRSDLDLRDAVSERRRLAGTLGTGTARLTIDTTSGDVSLERE